MNIRKNLWKVCALVMIVALALTVAAMRESSWVQAHDDDDGNGQPISLWLSSASLTYGETLRATLTNFNTRRVSVRPTFVDADGNVVKQAAEPLVLEPGQMRGFEVSRSEVGGGGPTLTSNNGQSVLLRPAMTMRKQEARKMLVTVEVVDEATGSAKLQAAGGNCPPFACGSEGNHNETLVRDTPPTK